MSTEDKSPAESISPSQCRAARALIEMNQAELARRAVVSTDTIADFENGSRIRAANALAAIRAALEFGGVIFIDGDEPGVKLRKRRR
jgi:transcriptional regulator with XRE-family HTH domain